MAARANHAISHYVVSWVIRLFHLLDVQIRARKFCFLTLVFISLINELIKIYIN